MLVKYTFFLSFYFGWPWVRDKWA